ncbi:hypothetical protein [Herpetosiphon gulosus]|uniref:Uncharacterized protein n=1 Tax=Herpetosiphon gulosus TaxID=1973496 RepID=A0ABP9X6I7_9CHLR
MKAITMTIQGEFYDSYIYAGLLYLWTLDGEIVTINWNKLIKSVSESQPDELQFATHCAFNKGSYLYQNEWMLFRKDIEMVGRLHDRFTTLASTPIEFDSFYNDMSKFIQSRANNSFLFPHADILLFHDNIFVGNNKGIESVKRTSINRNLKHDNNKKISDIPVFSLSANNYLIAMASGEDGMYEYNIQDTENKDVIQRSENECFFVRWIYTSIFGSSHEKGYIADFAPDNDAKQLAQSISTRTEISESQETLLVTLPKLERISTTHQDHLETPNSTPKKRKAPRKFKNFIYSANLFENSDEQDRYVWGSHDKICLINKDNIYVIKYNPNLSNRYKPMGRINITKSGLNIHELGDIVSCDSSYFGYIIEFDEGLVIINGNEEFMVLNGEPVNWRVFPDSRDYLNQMHVIYDDCIKILSFYDDYFINQNAKIAGLSKQV